MGLPSLSIRSVSDSPTLDYLISFFTSHCVVLLGSLTCLFLRGTSKLTYFFHSFAIRGPQANGRYPKTTQCIYLPLATPRQPGQASNCTSWEHSHDYLALFLFFSCTTFHPL